MWSIEFYFGLWNGSWLIFLGELKGNSPEKQTTALMADKHKHRTRKTVLFDATLEKQPLCQATKALLVPEVTKNAENTTPQCYLPPVLSNNRLFQPSWSNPIGVLWERGKEWHLSRRSLYGGDCGDGWRGCERGWVGEKRETRGKPLFPKILRRLGNWSERTPSPALPYISQGKNRLVWPPKCRDHKEMKPVWYACLLVKHKYVLN